jgi:hypothetical protein
MKDSERRESWKRLIKEARTGNDWDLDEVDSIVFFLRTRRDKTYSQVAALFEEVHPDVGLPEFEELMQRLDER